MAAMEQFQSALVGLAAEQQRAAAALAAAAATVMEAGARTFGDRWRDATATAQPSGMGATAAAQPSGMLDLCNHLIIVDQRNVEIKGGAVLILDPNVYTSAAAGMSKTFSDERRALSRAAAAALAALTAQVRIALSLAAAAGSAFASTIKAADLIIDTTTHRRLGEIGTEFYMGALVCAVELARPGAAAALSAAPSLALDIEPDSERAAAQDTATAAATLHPVQFLSARLATAAPATVAPATVAPAAARATVAHAPAVLRLPQVSIAVEYDIKPLIDRQAALQFGPIATTNAGLTPKLVKRLSSIRAVDCADELPLPLLPAQSQLPLPLPLPLLPLPLLPLPVRVEAGQRWPCTIDGRTVRELVPVPSAPSAPFAGPRPAALAHSALLADVIIEAAHAESEWLRGRNPLLEFERMVAAGDTVAAGDAVACAIASEFDRRLEAGELPKSVREFSDAATGPRAAEPSGYICSALMQLAHTRLEAMSRAHLARPMAGRVQLAALEREAHVTALVQSADCARLIQRRLTEEFGRSDGAAVAMAAAAKAAAPAAVRSHLTAALRTALTAALVKTPLNVSPPTLKLYAATM